MKFSAKSVFCSSHGVSPLGGIICDACKRIYPCELVAGELVFSEIDDNGKCSCGVQLTPSDAGGEFSARVVCATCVRAGKTWGMH